MQTITIILFLLVFADFAYADTLYLKNGRHINGLIKSEDNNTIELEVSEGVIKFTKSEIERIERTAPDDLADMRRKLEAERQDSTNRIKKRQLEELLKQKAVGFSRDSHGIMVRAVLNRDLEVTLLLDTGASVITLNKTMAEKLGIDLSKVKLDAKLTLADGRQQDAKRIILSSVEVQDFKTQPVEAVVLMEDYGGQESFDGLLGMSFLKRFNFKIDDKENKLILERLQ